MSLLAAASSSVRCDLCCQLLPSAAALAAHAASCFEELSQAFNDGLATAKGDWTVHTQAVLAASKLADELAASSLLPLPPSSLMRKDDPAQERKSLVRHAHTLLEMMASKGAPSKAVSSDALTTQLLQFKATHAGALREFSQQLLSQLPSGAADGTDDSANKLLLSAGVRLCSFVLNEAAFACGKPSRLLLHPPKLVTLSVEEFAQRFVGAWMRQDHPRHIKAGYGSTWSYGLCSEFIGHALNDPAESNAPAN